MRPFRVNTLRKIRISLYLTTTIKLFHQFVFCFMFPAISSVLHKISIKKYLHSKNKQNRSYGALMYSEHNYCKRFEQNIRKKALRIYNSRLDKKMPNFSFYELHCCDFPLLEANYMNYNPNIQYSTI